MDIDIYLLVCKADNKKFPNPKLSDIVLELMQDDPLYPIFNHNVYLPSKVRYPKVTYHVEDFLDGINIRVLELLAYVDECIETYGEEKVLINV